MWILRTLCVAHALALLFTSSAFAEEIQIKDTSGFVRAQSMVESLGSVDFTVVDGSGNPADGIEVTLTNEVTGEKITQVASNGVVTFTDLAPGTWIVSSSDTGIIFTNVAVAGAASGAGAVGVGSSLLIVGGTAGGVTAIAVAANSDDGDPLSPAS